MTCLNESITHYLRLLAQSILQSQFIILKILVQDFNSYYQCSFSNKMIKFEYLERFITWFIIGLPLNY